MQLAQLSSGFLARAGCGMDAACPLCRTPVIPKLGSIVVHHWAHRVADCDPWWEPESSWHRKWKSLMPDSQIEVTRGRHRADIVRGNGQVVELQHSGISVPEIREREQFYGCMVWLFDGTDIPDDRLILRPRDGFHTFRWKHARKHYGTCQRPVFIDLGEVVMRLNKMHIGPPCGGWGRLRSREVFARWLVAA